MSKKSDFIMIFADGESAEPSPNVRRGLGGTIKSAASKVSEVAVSTLQENFRCFLENLDTMISSSPKDVGGLVLDEIEIQAQIDSKGNIGISGIIGAEFAVQGGLKFVLRKKV